MTNTIALCLLMASHTYHVPPQVLSGIMEVEGGRVGYETGPNENGTYDLGPMQVNTAWIPKLAYLWHVDYKTAHRWIRDDGCVNVHVAAWVLKQKINEAGNLSEGVARYHSVNPKLGKGYTKKIIAAINHQILAANETTKINVQEASNK